MSRASPYSLELKLKVVREYDEGFGGYKALAQKYNLSRDLVRSWVSNASLRENNKIPVKDEKLPVGEKNLAYYKQVAAYWEDYAHQLEERLEIEDIF